MQILLALYLMFHVKQSGEVYIVEWIDAITQVINTCGFPIACVFIMFYMMNKERESHAEETSALTEAVKKLEIALTRILDKLDRKG